jgi:acetyl esterase/lipase
MMRKVSFQGTVWVKFVVFALLVFLGPTLFAFLCLHAFPSKARRDSLPPLAHGKAPTSIAELWRGYDPRKEKLDIELIKEWEQEGVVCRVLRYRIGVFKGKRAMMLAVYGFPKGGAHLPGLVQVHGGGQSANLEAVIANAQRGYACISLNWAGNPLGVPGYSGPNTDWGVVDATQNGHNDHFKSIEPDAKTIDAVQSGRNSNWFLLIIAARRALTFLERQPEVDGSKLGIYGHSMGANITLETAASDSRVKAAAPSCGGGADGLSDNLHGTPFSRSAYAPRVSCPMMFLNPANDFHAAIEDVEHVVSLLGTKEVRYTRMPHMNHQDRPEHMVCGPLWFDEHLKGTFRFPATPSSSLTFTGENGGLLFSVTPDPAYPVQAVDVYYALEGLDARPFHHRFWRHATAQRQGSTWSARLPVLDTASPLFAYANVLYALDKPVTGADYYYRTYTANAFSLASNLHTMTPAEFKEAGMKTTIKPSLLIESFADGWEDGWFTYDLAEVWPSMPLTSNKLVDPEFKAPAGAKLACDILAEQPNKLVLRYDSYVAEVQLPGDGKWQTIALKPRDFRNADGKAMEGWNPCGEFSLEYKDRLTSRNNGVEKVTRFGGNWQGSAPRFRNLRWEANPANGNPGAGDF